MANLRRRILWHKQAHQWHWISAALVLGGILIFSATGITLNHAAQIEGSPTIMTRSAMLPAALLGELRAPISPSIAQWIDAHLEVAIVGHEVEWSDDEAYVSMPRAGVDTWLSIDRTTGAIEYEATDRGWIAFFNDLHKGRNTGWVWSLFMDVIAVACLIFSISGFFLLQLQAKHRAATWPVLGAGAAVLVLIIVLH
ncbi:MAG: PepSY-associated TM helix domain-containing protein [Steroidobacteraceae bacterium]